MGTNLAAMLAQLKLENKELQESTASIDCTKSCGSSRGRSTVDIEHLERELQRARNKYDAALHSRQQQVAELEQLTMRCQEMAQPAGEQFVVTRLRCPVAHIAQLCICIAQQRCWSEVEGALPP